MIIVGAKGFAKEVLEVLEQNNYDKEIFFFDNISTDLPDCIYDTYRILRSFEEVEEMKGTDKLFTLGVGVPATRLKMYNKFLELGFLPYKMISPLCRIGLHGNKIGSAVNIMTGTVITNDIKIGNGSLINLNCTIGHDTTIGEFCELSPGVHLSGHCTVGRFSVLGTGSVLIPGITLGSNVVIGAGAVVSKDIPDNSVAVGIPAKIIKEIKPFEETLC